MNTAQSCALHSPLPVTTAAEAERLIGHFIDVMEALLGMVEQETALVRAGRLTEAAELQSSKFDLTHLYIADIARLKASQTRIVRLVPDSLASLHQRHDLFRALLQINLTVLATAQAVAEGILRGASGEAAPQCVPQTFGVGAQPNGAGPVPTPAP